jgi:hypothetical protein
LSHYCRYYINFKKLASPVSKLLGDGGVLTNLIIPLSVIFEWLYYTLENPQLPDAIETLLIYQKSLETVVVPEMLL